MPLLRGGIYPADGLPVPSARLEGSMRSVRLACSLGVFVAQTPQLASPPDEKVRFFLGWWQRMHQGSDPLVAIALKFVEWTGEDGAAQRFVWEVCRWPQGRSLSWKFVCWMVDGDGMWMKEFSSKRAAMAYFRQSPTVVLAGPAAADAAPPYSAAS